MQQVFVAQHPTEAHLVRGVLEAEGVLAVVQGESLFSARGEAPVTPDTLPSVWVINDADATRAVELLADYRLRAAAGGRATTPWVCSACGEEVDGQFSACWKCGVEDVPNGQD